MLNYKIHTEETAPEGSKELLADSQKKHGMIPNLHAVMAEAPSLLSAYKAVGDLFLNSSFSKEEMTVVWQSINVEHNCHYCVPAHTAIAKSMGVDEAISNALRDETELPNPRLEALRVFTLKAVRNRGIVDDKTTKMFLEAGFTKRHVLEIIVGIAQKVMSNYTNHFAETPVDEPFKSFAWKKAD